MSCKKCTSFLEDFLQSNLSKDLPITKDLRQKAIQKILPDYIDWMYRLCFRLSREDFDKSYKNACQIARRGRKQLDYEYILFTSTSNFLSFQHPWFSKELDYMKVLLVEAGFIKTKRQGFYLILAREYLTYMIPRCIFMLRHLHDDHLNPKGLMTDLSTTIGIPKEKETSKETLCDKDNSYQTEILQEVQLEDDLYT